MTAYLWGLFTPVIVILAGLLVINAPRILRGALGNHHVRHTTQALKLLLPTQQQKVLDFWRAPSRYRAPDHQPLTNAYTKREDVYGAERALTTGDISAFLHYGPLLPRLLKRGLYPVLAKNIPAIAEEARQEERRQAALKRERQRQEEAKRAERAAAEAATKARITELLGPEHSSVTFIHYPSGSLKKDLNTVLYLPEAPEYEPDPRRSGVLVKSPALAVHVTTDFGHTVRAYMSGNISGDGQYHGLDLDRRLRAAHPEIYTDQETPTP